MNQYIHRDIQERLVDPVHEGLNELRTGFQSAINLEWCKAVGMTALDLRKVVCGNVENGNATRDFDVRSLFRIRMDSDVSENTTLQKALFGAISAMSPQDKRLFLKFVTGVDKLPLPKTECLKIEAPGLCFSRAEFLEHWSRIPTAHTCFNTLEIPNYAECLLELEHDGRSIDQVQDLQSFEDTLQRHVAAKLAIAIANTEGGGYGLDEAVSKRENDLLVSRPGGDPNVGESERKVHLNTESIRNIESQTNDEPVLDTGRSSVRSFGGNESSSSLDIPGVSESDDDDIFNAF